MSRILIGLVGLALIVIETFPASTRPPSRPADVSHAGLDLTDPRTFAELNHRIAETCDRSARADEAVRDAVERCRKAAFQTAADQVLSAIDRARLADSRREAGTMLVVR